MSSVKVTIKDFQSVENLDLEILGFTCVTGPTNIGKSAIIRAISSAILNKPVVGSVRKGKRFCTVSVDDLKWEKGDGVGRYWVPGEVDESGNPKPRDSIGRGQTEVTELMGFRSVKVGDKYINPWLATQFEPIFLMQDSGPAVTDFISDITHLKVLQDAIVVCTRKRQRFLSAAKDREEELAAATEKEAKLEGLDNLLRAEKDLVQQAASLDEYRASIARLRQLISSIAAERSAIELLLPVKEVKAPRQPADPSDSLMPVARLWRDIESAALRVSPIKGIMKVSVPEAPDPEELEAARRTSRFLLIPSLSASVALLEPARKVSVPDAPEDGTPALLRAASLLRDIGRAEAALLALSAGSPRVPEAPSAPDSLSRGAALLRAIEAEERFLVALEDQLEKAESDLERVSEELASIPTCPTCRQVMAKPHAHA